MNPVTAATMGSTTDAIEPIEATLPAGTELKPEDALEPVLAQARNGDPAAFRTVYDQFGPAIFRFFCRRTGDAEVAADLTSEVFLRVHRAIDADQTWRVSFTSWLYRIARNQLIDHLRSVRRRPQTELTDALPYAGGDGMDEHVDRRLVAREVRRVLHELRPEYAQVLRLRFFKEMSHAEIGRALGKSEAAIKVTHHRALRAFQRECQRHPLLAAA
jgi:RNA polymerase sigma-70 factor (ECF subfamily)